ncbi:hypothetical protein CA267_016900 [Alteromonas pelagimontana]|uniref:DUF4136 domain-containing protein n=1 Tax=Alteromonas pelagimontana TaxID=1858656 RepID=A0A6M4MH48_9ALTE|nr:hypothetical protein [Alteromonas pelagimontana]QJR82307.1 hypothetical protein CA267_016900 [Alteromonas pelagimontana]
MKLLPSTARIPKCTLTVLMSGILMVAACSSLPSVAPTPYQSAKTFNGYGYSSVQLSDNEYRVMFKATDETPADKVQEYTLYRSAELAKERGYSWVAIVKTDVEKKGTIGKTVTRSRNEPKPPVMKDEQCTMSGCSEIVQPLNTGTEMSVETKPMNDIYYSVMVRMGANKVSTGNNAFAVDEILSTKPD